MVWRKNFGAISSLSLSEDKTLLYSASGDKTFKVWRISDSKCLESVAAHNDAVNSIVAGFDGLVFTGSADGSIKVGGSLFSHSRESWFSGSADTGICVWRRLGSDHVCLSLLNGHTGPVKCLAAEKDKKSISHETPWILYSASVDKSVKMWRVSENAPPVAWNGCASAMPISLPPARSSDRSRINHRRH
ncbi:hypothetical protein GH714_031638 [Hevea brasiliensis]|uniref:Uncharacterized protein n=1 Tax=Hevea brasiliensis TaxID=3981 RepID=A0A6A6L4X4_HEVBR|nr:hypothetical protein GH714_031638 [Hevea brasiliensis]